jgi:hypothetical protein
MLRRMAARGELKCQEFDGLHDWFMLNTTQRIKDPRKYQHETAAADLFVSLYSHLKGGSWSYEPFILKERADRGMRLAGKTFYFEVDRGTESLREIEAKLDNYISYARHSGERFHVVFALLDGKQTAHRRGEDLIPLLQGKKRGNQLLLVHLKRLAEDPLGKWLYSPTDELYSIQDVI